MKQNFNFATWWRYISGRKVVENARPKNHQKSVARPLLQKNVFWPVRYQRPTL